MLSDLDADPRIPPSHGMPSLPMTFSAAQDASPTQSEARFRALAQATGQIYWIADAQGHLTDSTSWRAFTGQTAEEVGADDWADAVHPDDREFVLVDWAAAVASGQPYRREHRVRRADGQYRMMLAQAYPVLAADGTVREWVGVDTDTTLLQELRADVQASQEEFRATFEQAAVGMAHVRLDGRILRVNHHFCEILGYTAEELVGHTFQELTYPPDLDTNLALLEQMRLEEISTYTLDKRYMRKDGSLVWVSLTASLKRDRAGAPEYGIAVIKDIGPGKAAEEALRQSEQQYRQLFETMAQGVIYFSPGGAVLSANPAALQIVGTTPGQIAGRTTQDPRRRVIREDGSPFPDEAMPTTRTLRTGQMVSDVVGVFNYKEGAYRWLKVTAIPEFRPGDQTPYRVFATFDDITERQRLEEELRARVQELEAVFASMNDGLIVHSAEGVILRTNPAYAALVGWPDDAPFHAMSRQDRLLTLQIRDGQGRPIPLEDLPLSRNLRGESVTQEQIFQNRQGQDRCVIVRGAPLTDAAGRVIGSVEVIHDVTEQRRLEREAAARARELEAVFASMNEGLIVLGPDGRILRANPAYAALAGWPAGSALYAMSPEERHRALHIRDEQGQPIPPDQFPASRVLRGETISEEQIFRKADGRDRYVSLRGAPLTNAAGHVIGAVQVLHDNTEQQRLEREVAAHARELEAIFASMNEGLIVFRGDGMIQRTNPAYRALLGWPADSAFYAMSLEERRQALQMRDSRGELLTEGGFPLERVLRGESLAQEEIVKTQDDRDLYLSVRGAPLTDAAGQVEGAVLVLHDLTLRHQLEQQTQAALKALLRMAELLVQHPSEREEQQPLPVGQHLAELACSLLGCPVATIITLDPQTMAMQVLGTVGYTSEQERRLHSIIASWVHSAPDLADITRLMAGETLALDVTQLPYREFAALFDVQQAIIAPMQLSGQVMGIVVFNPSKHAQTFTDQQIALAGATAQLVGLMVERGRLLREREEARAHALALHESNRQMDTFLGIVSHELRSPLASMKLGVQLIHRRLARAFSDAPGAERRDVQTVLSSLQDFFTPVERQVLRLERLVKDLLDASRIKEGQLELRLERADLNAIVQEVLAEQRELTPERVIQLQTPPDQPLFVEVDADLIRQAVINYLTNALKYSPETAPVAIGVEQAPGAARVWVRDQGPGIPPEDQEHIWERFYRAPGIQAQGEALGGLGLGLYVTKMLIERHQGQVGITSTPDQGTTFWFTLPLPV